MSLEHFDKFCGSKFWDLNVTWYTDQPDFTPCFEKTVLVWVPGILLLLLLPIEVYYIRSSKDRNIPWNWLNILKVFLLVILLALCAVDYINVSLKESASLPDVYASVVRGITFCLLLVLVLYNKAKGLQISGVQFTFWLFMVVCGAVQLRTMIQHALKKEVYQFDFISYIVYYAVVCVNFLLQFFADEAQTYSEHVPLERPSPENSSSFPSQICFSWMNPLISKGSKQPLTDKDIWNLSHENSAKEVVALFEKYWTASVRKKSKSSKAFYSPDGTSISFSIPSRKKRSIVPALCKAFGPNFLIASALRLSMDIFNFVNPQILRLLIEFVSSDDFAWKGYLFAFLLLLVTTFQSITLTHYNRVVSVVGIRIRCALVNIIFKKSLKLSNSAYRDTSIGNIVNLMSVDTQSFQMLMFLLNMIWSAPLQVALALYFLYDLLGISVVAGFVTLVILVPINGLLINYSKNLKIQQMKYKDDRIKLMNEILSGVKVLKLYAWESSFEQQVLSIREKELNVLKKAAYVDAATNFLWSCVPFIVAFSIFTTYVLLDKNNILTAEKAFVAISLVNIIRFPLSIFPMLISSLVMTSVSVKRINDFMNNDELDEDCIIRDQGGDPIVVDNGAFSWDKSDGKEATLHNINLRVKEGELVAVVGSVGMGKSSLISALLGELDKVSGSVSIKGTVAYVPQQAWLQNATLKDNILFGKIYDVKRYSRTVKACALEQDLDMLPAGDQTEIGEKGINLSGGQKQRVSLSRAVYNDADIYFLDDPLSAVDSHVGKHIFENVIGPKGLLKQKTRILVTHAVTYLPEMDYILVMNNGTISECGTYKELLTKKGAFADFLVQYMQESRGEVEDEELEKLKKQLLEYEGELPPKLSRELSRHSSHNSVHKLERSISTESKSSINKPYPSVHKDKLIVAESLETGQVTWNVYSYYLQAIGSYLTLTCITLIAMYQVCTVGGNAWLSVWSSDTDISINGTQTFQLQLYYLEVYAAFGLGQMVSKLLSSICLALGGLYAACYLQAKMLNKVLHSPMSFFDTTPLGRIINRFSKEVDTVDSLLPNNLQIVLAFAMQLIGTIAVITYSTPIFICVVIPITILTFSIQKFYMGSARQLKRIESVTKSPVYSHFSECLAGVKTVRAYRVQKTFITQCEKNADTNFACFYSLVISLRWISVRLECLGNLVVFFAALFAVLAKDTMDAGQVGLSVSYALQVTSTLFLLVREITNLETNTISVERIKEYSELPEEADWERDPKPDPRWPRKGVIEFKDYAVSYRKGLDLVLKGVTFKIKPGEKVGIVGQTGAGKSSLTLALFRLLEAERGQIMIDDVDISKLGLHDLRSRLTIIPQDPVLFSGTLRINLDPFGLHKDDSIWYALELAHLKNYVLGLPAGLQHQLSEGGENLSVGQRQLICLARALLRRSKILVLDEATAAVDLETDDLIQQTIRLVFKESTVLTIAHRLNTIMDYNRVLVIDKGLVVEYDSPENLLNSNTSKFYQLAKDAGIV